MSYYLCNNQPHTVTVARSSSNYTITVDSSPPVSGSIGNTNIDGPLYVGGMFCEIPWLHIVLPLLLTCSGVMSLVQDYNNSNIMALKKSKHFITYWLKAFSSDTPQSIKRQNKGLRSVRGESF